jgi:putative SOS response-associated peptidase YedK
MCGRYALLSDVELLAELFELAEHVPIEPRYNLAPTQMAPVVRASASVEGRTLSMMRWGLIPFWAKDASIGNRMINARSETAASKPAFRDAMEQRRCLVPADAFYEWKKIPGGKQPFCIRRADGAPMAFAGLWASWRRAPGEEKIRSFTILTTLPNVMVSALHDRMPAILEPERFAAWLDPNAEPAALRAMLAPAADGVLELFPVSRRVNAPANDDPACMTPVEISASAREDDDQPRLF